MDKCNTVGNIRIADVARIMRKSPQFVRVGLQRGLLPFGTAFKMPGSSEYSYFVSAEKLADYLGVTVEKLGVDYGF